MPKTREQKEQIVNDLTDKFGRMKSAVFTEISGYTMSDANQLRAEARENGVEVLVARKALLAIAAKNANLEGVDPAKFEGSVLTAIGFQDEVAPARMMAEFVKERETMNILGGVLEQKAIDEGMVKSLAKLPSKQELLAKMVGSINAPVSGFVNVLAGNLRGLVGVLNAIKETK